VFSIIILMTIGLNTSMNTQNKREDNSQRHACHCDVVDLVSKYSCPSSISPSELCCLLAINHLHVPMLFGANSITNVIQYALLTLSEIMQWYTLVDAINKSLVL
jgi:hypothetical protein